MSNITLNLQGSFQSFAENSNWMMNEASDVYASYWATDANVLVSALPSGTSGASLNTKFTKTVYQNSLGFVEQMNKFFSNSAVTTGDYLSNIENVIYANAGTPAIISPATESLADRMKVLCEASLSLFKTAKDILNAYNNSELSVIVAGCSGSRVVYGAAMNVTQLIQGITLVEQFKKMINNEAVTTGLYSANVAIWKMV